MLPQLYRFTQQDNSVVRYEDLDSRSSQSQEFSFQLSSIYNTVQPPTRKNKAEEYIGFSNQVLY